ncbi:MAG: hypothetical protein EA356_09775 [Geminicoccaceae bacterium]|nr:MAG: hypothetical protein EA356_09775 [Geminicoccaceae bacterium]
MRRWTVGAIVATLLLAGCAVEPYQPDRDTRINPDGPGIFSGPTGRFELENGHLFSFERQREGR